MSERFADLAGGHNGQEILIYDDQVMARIQEMAAELLPEYRNTDVLFVFLLLGGVSFTKELMHAFARLDPDFHADVDCLDIATYNEQNEAGQSVVTRELAASTRVAGRRVAVLDDILDTGLTAVAARDYLLGLGAESVDHIVLVQKQIERPHFPQATLAGFTIEDAWVNGWGMDTKGKHRWLDHIVVQK